MTTQGMEAPAREPFLSRGASLAAVVGCAIAIAAPVFGWLLRLEVERSGTLGAVARLEKRQEATDAEVSGLSRSMAKVETDVSWIRGYLQKKRHVSSNTGDE